MLKKIFNTIPDNFDITIYLRYWPIVRKINCLNKNDLKIAEVGSGGLGVGPYLKKNFTGFDIAFSGPKSPFLKPVVVSATKIPQEYTKQFDFVFSVDMLEHLPPKSRPKALKNMVSLTGRYLLVAFPSGPQAVWADKLLAWYYQKTHQEKLNFLTEHLKFSLPEAKKIEDQLVRVAQKQNKKVISSKRFSNTNVFVYLGLLLFGFSQKKYLTRLFSLTFFLRGFLAKINFFSYRKMIILEFED